MLVLNTSALDIDLASIAAEPPDVMIVDPPYRAHVHKSAVSQSVGGGSRSRDLGFESLSVALRAFFDSPDLLMKAADYVKFHAEPHVESAAE